MARARVPATGALVLAAAVAMVLGGVAGASRSTPGEEVAPPTVTGPITTGGGISLVAPASDLLTANGYIAEEYFFDGTATAYEPARPLTADGRWQLEANGTAPYESRMVVYRPADAADFNGTVYVEWLNVTSGFETPAVYGLVHNEVLREGAAWIGVSAQAGGIQGEETIIDVAGAPPGGIKKTDPVRYGPLSHPGDLYSFDVFSQAGIAAAGDAQGVNPLGDLEPERVIAIGKSQSAFRLMSYVDGVQPLASVFDGFLIASRHRSGAPLGPTAVGLPDDTVPKTLRIRTDAGVPVLVVQTETDVESFQSARARQPDSKTLRLWEIAGSAHADIYSGAIGFADTGDGTVEQRILDPTNADGGALGCSRPVNSGPTFAVLSAALAHLDDWVRDGTAPPKAPRLETTGTDEPSIVRDEHGNAVGGIRTPLVDVPIATLTGEENEGSNLCSLFGRTTPFDAATLARLYPTRADYVQAFDASADRTTKAGFWLRREAENFKAAAAQLPVGR